MKKYFSVICLLFLISCFSENVEKNETIATAKQNPIMQDSIVLEALDTLNSLVLKPSDTINIIDKNGNKQGKWVQKLKNGFVLRENNYLDGKKHGEQIEYYGNKDICQKGNYKNGKREGYQYSFYEGINQIGMIAYYENDSNVWVGFPRANEKFIKPIKDFHINTDSIYVIAPYNNGNKWYEGTFVNREERSTTGKRLGIHKVYHKNGQLKALLNCDTKRITEYDSLGNILRNNDTFENGITLPTNYKR